MRAQSVEHHAENSLMSRASVSRMAAVSEFFGDSTSSAITRSARLPGRFAPIPTHATDGDLSMPLSEWCTSNASVDVRSPEDLSGRRHSSVSTVRIMFLTSVAISLAVPSPADTMTTRHFGFWIRDHTANIAVIVDFASPRCAWIMRFLGPYCKYDAMSCCIHVGAKPSSLIMSSMNLLKET